MEIHGATPAEWDHFAGKLNLRQDLLPVVSDPSAEISENSRMKDKGKTPSIFNREGKVVGIKQWTGINADEGDVRRWSRDGRLGICIQTRYARAIDIDVADPAMADAIEQAVRDAVPGVRWSTRWRANSGKRLMPFIFEGELYKRSFPVGSERVELLAYGQQFIAKGRHPSGAHYEWGTSGGSELPDGFPVLTADEVESLWDTLEMLFATGDGFRARKPREGAGNGSTAGEGTDRVLAYLAELGLILEYGPGDQAYIECPWAGEHSSDNGVTQTAYFPAGTGGYARGHFKCMHDHCADRSDADFMEALGYEPEGADDEDFEDLTRSPGSVTVNGEAATRAVVKRALPGVPGLQDGGDIEQAVPGSGVLPEWKGLPTTPGFKRNLAGGPNYGAILVTQDNVTKAFEQPEFCARKLRWDTFRDAVVWAGWNEAEGAEVWRTWVDVDYARAARTLDQRNFQTTPGIEKLRAAVMDVAMRNEYDSAIAWLAGLEPWDGVSRVETFLSDCLGSEDSPYVRAVSRYMWTALAGRVMNPGCKADMAIILVDPGERKQGRGKTSLVEALVPDAEWFGEVDFTMKEDEAGRIMRGKVVVELAELNGMRGKAREATKKFISRRFDEWVPKYFEASRRVPRRSIFIGTTNEDQFLADPTGERRWLPVVIGQSNVIRIAQERDQLWAEALHLWRQKYTQDRARGELEYRSGVMWETAEELARVEHEKFKVVDDWDNEVENFLHGAITGDGQTPAQIGEFTMADIFAHMNRGLPTRADEMRMADLLRQKGWNNRARKQVGERKIRMWRKNDDSK